MDIEDRLYYLADKLAREAQRIPELASVNIYQNLKIIYNEGFEACEELYRKKKARKKRNFLKAERL